MGASSLLFSFFNGTLVLSVFLVLYTLPSSQCQSNGGEAVFDTESFCFEMAFSDWNAHKFDWNKFQLNNDLMAIWVTKCIIKYVCRYAAQ